MRKVWLICVLCSLVMVVGCSGKVVTEEVQKVSEETVVSNVTATEGVVEDSCDVFGKDSLEETNLQEQDMETEKEEIPTQTSSEEEETVDAQEPSTEQPAEKESTTEIFATDECVETDETDIQSTESMSEDVPATKPEAEFTGYDANRVVVLATEKCKAAGMITIPEDLDKMLAEGEITQEEYNEYYPYDGCGYYSVFVETNLNLASTTSGRKLGSEEEIADYIAGMMVLEVKPYFYIEYAGVYQGDYTEFYEFRCYR